MSNRIRLIVAAAAAAALTIAGCIKDTKPKTLATTQPVEMSLKIKSSPVVQPAVGFQQRMGDEIVVAGHFYRIGTPVVTWMDHGGYDAYRTERHFAKYDAASYLDTQELLHPGRVIEAARKKAEAATKPKPASMPENAFPKPATRKVTTQVAAVYDFMQSPSRYGYRYTDATLLARYRATTRPDYIERTYAGATTMPLTPEEFALAKNSNWTLEALQQRVDQFVIHYDVAGTSQYCFDVLHDDRNLSVHFMLDLDGTLYQTLDLKERAYHATISNNRSIGIEIANIGSYATKGESQTPLVAWYKKDEAGQTYLSIPANRGGLDSQRTKPSVLRPIRNDPVVGTVQGYQQRMYDLTPQQYAALIKLTAALGDIFPKITIDYPRDADGKLIDHVLDDVAWGNYHGVLGHYHVQKEKNDPGVAFQWDYVIDNAKKLLAERRAMATK